MKDDEEKGKRREKILRVFDFVLIFAFVGMKVRLVVCVCVFLSKRWIKNREEKYLMFN